MWENQFACSTIERLIFENKNEVFMDVYRTSKIFSFLQIKENVSLKYAHILEMQGQTLLPIIT